MENDQELRQLIVSMLATEADADGTLDPMAPTTLSDGGLDLTSLELVRLLVNLEEYLDIELDDVEIMNAHFETVDDIVALVGASRPPSGWV